MKGPNANRRRADLLLVERGLFPTRARAQAAIAAGLVRANGQTVDKPSAELPLDATLEGEAAHPYVSRGGVKLAAALDAFAIDPVGLTCIDVGASTGGFTDVLLRRGAARVTCVDTGRGQLHETVRNHARVEMFEATDVRIFAGDPARAAAFDLAVIDVSFIGLAAVLQAVATLLNASGQMIALVKPQFEVGRAHIGKGGIVRDETIRLASVERAREAAAALGFGATPAIESPISGGDGNREYLFAARRVGR